MNKIIYKFSFAKEVDIALHLHECDIQFSPLLSSYVNIDNYTEKIKNNALTFEAWHNNKLVGLVACYANDIKHIEAYITNISVLATYTKKGIAGNLLDKCIRLMQKKDFKSISLEVIKENCQAIYLYEKRGFIERQTISNKSIVMQKSLEEYE